jgi:DUF917 family protein
LYKGKVWTSRAVPPRAFCAASCGFDGLDDWRGSAMTINFQNEWIVA